MGSMPPATERDDSAVFPLLADTSGYRACTFDLAQYPDRRAYWLDLFRDHFHKLLLEAGREAEDRGVDASAAIADARDGFFAYLDGIDAPAEPLASLTILEICHAREHALRAAGIADPYRLAKQAENDQALERLPGVLAALDALPDSERALAVLQGVFAGNIYDLGATKTIDMFTDKRVDFDAVRAKLKPRPWFIDDADQWLERVGSTGLPPYRCACLFVDNAGPDITLGMLPLARFLLSRGTEVILTANTEPSLNDVTHDELETLIETAAGLDPLIAQARSERRLHLVPSGNWAPLIDLSRVSPALAATVSEHGVDLVVLEGMGRGLESNFDARLSCDCLKLAMIKDLGVADALGGAELFDLVCRFESV
ncbi:MAG: ARMT1-like domain-containing protein [Planctomycetota bacterium]